MMTGGVDSQDFGGGGRGTLFLLSAKLFFAPNSMVRKKSGSRTRLARQASGTVFKPHGLTCEEPNNGIIVS